MKALLFKQLLEELVALWNQPDATMRNKIRKDLRLARVRFVVDGDNHTGCCILTIDISASSWQRPVPLFRAFNNLHRMRRFKVG